MKPKYFCFFIRQKEDGFYTRFEKICLALRIGYYHEVVQLLLGKDNYIWIGNENNPIPY